MEICLVYLVEIAQFKLIKVINVVSISFSLGPYFKSEEYYQARVYIEQNFN